MDAMTKPMKVLFMFSEQMAFHGKNYLYTSQEKSLKILKQQHGYSIGRRQFNYVLRYLEDNTLIKRQRRHKTLPGGRISPMTSLTFLTKKAHRLIARLFKSLLKAVKKDIRKVLNRDPRVKSPKQLEKESKQRWKDTQRLYHLKNQDLKPTTS